MKSIESRLTEILVFTLLSVIAWAVWSFMHGQKLLPGEVDLTEVIFEACTAVMVFLGFAVSITLNINTKFKRLLNLGFLLLFYAVSQDFIDELIIFDSMLPRLIEDAGIPLGFLLVGLGLFGLSRDYQESSTQLQDTKAREQWLATTDELTQLTSRQEFIRSWPEVFAQSQNDQQSLAALTFKMDNIDSVNDEHGYSAGNAALQEIALVLTKYQSAHCRLLTRLKGREFILILAGLDDDFIDIITAEILSHTAMVMVKANGAEPSLVRPVLSHSVIAPLNEERVEALLR